MSDLVGQPGRHDRAQMLKGLVSGEVAPIYLESSNRKKTTEATLLPSVYLTCNVLKMDNKRICDN